MKTSRVSTIGRLWFSELRKIRDLMLKEVLFSDWVEVRFSFLTKVQISGVDLMIWSSLSYLLTPYFMEK